MPLSIYQSLSSLRTFPPILTRSYSQALQYSSINSAKYGLVQPRTSSRKRKGAEHLWGIPGSICEFSRVMSAPALNGQDLKRGEGLTFQFHSSARAGESSGPLYPRAIPVLQEDKDDCHCSSGFQTLVTSLHPQPMKMSTISTSCDSQTGLIWNSLPMANRWCDLLISTVTSSMSAH